MTQGLGFRVQGLIRGHLVTLFSTAPFTGTFQKSLSGIPHLCQSNLCAHKKGCVLDILVLSFKRANVPLRTYLQNRPSFQRCVCSYALSGVPWALTTGIFFRHTNT